jgi:rhamnosyltransferase subunit B
MTNLTLRVLVVAEGSAGDVHPFAAVAQALHRRGHEVIFIGNAHFEPLLAKMGIELAAHGTAEEHQRAMASWIFTSREGLPRFVTRQVERMPIIYRLIEERVAPGRTVVLARTLTWAARVARETFDLKLVSLLAQPFHIRSVSCPPVLQDEMPIDEASIRAMFRRGDQYLDSLCAPPIEEFRRSRGLPPLVTTTRSWAESPDLVLGLFPAWFAPPQPDWPQQVRLAGFPGFDGDTGGALPVEATQFLDSGPAPVVFSPGSIRNPDPRWMDAALECSARSGLRAVLLDPHDHFAGRALPAGTIRFPWLPHRALFSRARAVVHHGGIGTVSAAFSAGVPQVVVPVFYDQPDNAERVARLGAGAVIPSGELSGERWPRPWTSSSATRGSTRPVARSAIEWTPTPPSRPPRARWSPSTARPTPSPPNSAAP